MNIIDLLKHQIEDFLIDNVIILNIPNMAIFYNKNNKLYYHIQRVDRRFYVVVYDDYGNERDDRCIGNENHLDSIGKNVKELIYNKTIGEDIAENIIEKTETVGETLFNNGIKNEKVINDYKNVILHTGNVKLTKQVRLICDYFIDDKDFRPRGEIFNLIGYSQVKQTVKLMNKKLEYIFMTLEEYNTLTEEVKC